MKFLSSTIRTRRSRSACAVAATVLAIVLPTTMAYSQPDEPERPPSRTPTVKITLTSWLAPFRPTGTPTATPTPSSTPTASHTATETATQRPPSLTPTATRTVDPSTPVPTSLASNGTRPPLSFSSASQLVASPTADSANGPTATTTRDIPPPPPIRYAGVPSTSAEAKWLDSATLWLGIPHRTQLDDSIYAQSNCGPASLGMILGGYGLAGYPTDALRGEVNRLQGNADPNQGTSLPALAAVAQRAGLHPIGLYAAPGTYKRWTIDELRTHLKAGRPLITLARYADLPGNSYFAGDTNHYIVLSGLAGDNFIYNDAAYFRGIGRGLMMAPDVLSRAWANSVIPGHAVAFALDATGGGVLSRQILPVSEDEGPSEDLESIIGGEDNNTVTEPGFVAFSPPGPAGPDGGIPATIAPGASGTVVGQPSGPTPLDPIPAALGTSALLLAWTAGAIAFGRRGVKAPA